MAPEPLYRGVTARKTWLHSVSNRHVPFIVFMAGHKWFRICFRRWDYSKWPKRSRPSWSFDCWDNSSIYTKIKQPLLIILLYNVPGPLLLTWFNCNPSIWYIWWSFTFTRRKNGHQTMQHNIIWRLYIINMLAHEAQNYWHHQLLCGKIPMLAFRYRQFGNERVINGEVPLKTNCIVWNDLCLSISVPYRSNCVCQWKHWCSITRYFVVIQEE